MEGEIFRTVQISPVAHPAYYTLDTWPLLVVKRPERGVFQYHPFSAEVKERVELYL